MRKVFRLFALENLLGTKYVELEFESKYDGEMIEEGFARLALVLSNGISVVANERRFFYEVGIPGKWTL